MAAKITTRRCWTIAELETLLDGDRYELITALDRSRHLTLAPELIVEVLSKAEQDQKRECRRRIFDHRETKLQLYSVQGVEEYWVGDRECQVIEVDQRSEEELQLMATLAETEWLTSSLLSGFRCLVGSLFV